MAAMTLALDVFLRLIGRRDELRARRPNNPVDKEELATLEELVIALAGSDAEGALEAHADELSRLPLSDSLH